MRTLFLFLFVVGIVFGNPLQEAIQNAPVGATIELGAGVFAGDIVITKPIRLKGIKGKTLLRGSEKGTVLTIRSSDVVLENLTVKNSGKNAFSRDSGILIENAQNVTVRNCVVKQVLHGIDIERSKGVVIENSTITSYENSIPLRGDGVKVFYSSDTTLRNNTIYGTRDISITFSNGSKIIGNLFENNRFATHFERSNDNLIKNNTYRYNSVALMFMGTKNSMVRENRILSSKGAAAIGVVVGKGSGFHFEDNSVRFNAKGLYIEATEKARGMKRYLIGNDISYNKEALHFHAAIRENTIRHNRFVGNIDDVVLDLPGSFESSNDVALNHWDRYAGFDSDRDGIGDTPFILYRYVDKLWQQNHRLKYFFATPVLSFLNFLSELAPFVQPTVLMIDPKPLLLKQD